jgi:hypothetical protein
MADDFTEYLKTAAESFRLQGEQFIGEGKQALLDAAARLQGLVADFQSHPFTPEQMLALLDTNKAELASDLGIIKEKAKRAYVSGVIDLVFGGLSRLLGA